ncbi:tRNA threonylcarbamoyladenosine biosynthesis protein TsaB [Gottschalkia purinilytica]|uniref:tRNA threonylcarbamoyladenosine biosynthesis protein TsaB n=1 Tax=Gottschalkia purinilytica TaxID=1503 RepID=A0A0L0WDR6_GOTPU|nr:tRNA (adenosine(37)-N6)-threonylcarbamoyltransferase complex dimerization subunit type 1 TsaB [Gottschalkia purinilytica]KNF09622.1 tRNA threonylcarbamoyladenosine biosynthesis protein TsaB [Gottschalkia purinilytica]
MKVLAIDTSSTVATVAIMDDEKLIGEYTINDKMTHSQKLMPIIRDIMKASDLNIDEIDVFGVSKGPGSFTGLRIGIATIKSLAHSVEKDVVGISTLDALAFNIPFSNGIIVPIMDARRERVFTGIYKWESGGLHIIRENMVIEVDELMKILKERPENIIFNGDGTLVYKDKIIKELGDKSIFAPKHANMARASSIAELTMAQAKEGKTESYLTLVPNYLRESQAQRELDKKNCEVDKNE